MKNPIPRNRTGRMKGQNLVFERVMLFAIGVAIFIACFAVFDSYQKYYTIVGRDDQLSSLGAHVSFAILDAAKKSNSTEATIKLDIPPVIGGENYILSLTQQGLNITMTHSKRHELFHLYGLNESFKFGGEKVLSRGGELLIYKKGNLIILQ